MNPALIVVDMVRDNIKPEYPISTQVRALIPRLQRLLVSARAKGFPVVFACDSYLPDDFIFRGKMKPHAIQGTPGAEVIEELSPHPTDLVIPKRRFSAFFQTGLEGILKARRVDTLVVVGVATNVCVLMTALDGICHDFRVFILEDCCATYRPEIHQSTVKAYERSPLEPLLQLITLETFMALLENKSHLL